MTPKPTKKIQPFIDFLEAMDKLPGRVKQVLVSEPIRRFMDWPPFGTIVRGTQIFETFTIGSFKPDRFLYSLVPDQEHMNRLAEKHVKLNKKYNGSKTTPADRGPSAS